MSFWEWLFILILAIPFSAFITTRLIYKAIRISKKENRHHAGKD